MLSPTARPNLKTSTCRFCGTPLTKTFVNLGTSPASNSYLRTADLQRSEMHHPLHAYVCGSCFLVQLEEFESPEQIFSDYAYFSSYSESWLRHAATYCASMSSRFGLDRNSHVIEVASNDGYLLKNFVRQGVRVLGVEPAGNVAKAAIEAGVPTMTSFFSRETARRIVGDGVKADLLVANNVMAHVPNLNDFIGGFKIVLAPEGVVTVEFPHLLNLMNENQFDTIYHEHFSYFSFLTAEALFAAHGLRIFDVEKLTTHGGSLRIYGCHTNGKFKMTAHVGDLVAEERAAGLDDIATYSGFEKKVHKVKWGVLSFLLRAREQRKTVAAFGAAAKGNTLLNYCGVGPEFIDYVVDSNPHKQGLFMPGSRIPIYAPDHIHATKPDYVLILPWNLASEITTTHSYIKNWGGQFVVPIPEVRIVG